MGKIVAFALFIGIFLCFSCKDQKEKSQVKTWSKFNELPVQSIKPKGWLHKFLENQKNGLTGHLENAGYPFNTCGWQGDSIPGNIGIEKWWPYEQNAYWVDGMIRCGYLLNDSFLIKKALSSIQYVLDHQDSSGFLGPIFLKPAYERDRWVHNVFFRSMMAEFSASNNKHIIEAMEKHYLKDTFSYKSTRESTNIENILWLYAQTQNTKLLQLAEEIYKNSDILNKKEATSAASFLKDSIFHEHGVTYNEKAKIGAILYIYTGKEEYLKPSVAAFKRIDKYHYLVGGVNVSTEHLDTITSQEGYEICDISDYTWSLGYMLMASGDMQYADKIERAIFNAAPGAVTTDFKALQYFSCPNQAVASKWSFVRSGGPQLRYAPNPGTECCPGNVNRMMPNYALRLWMQTPENGLAAVMYAPSEVSWKVGKNNQEITIEENTNYPFSDQIEFIIKTKEEVEFPFVLRIPQWCKNASLKLNGKPIDMPLNAGSFITLNQKFNDKDKVTLLLPQEFKFEEGPENGVSLLRGPLVYSLSVQGDWIVDTAEQRSTKEFPAYNVYPKSKWNYAIAMNLNDVSSLKLIEKTMNDDPWSAESSPYQVRIPMREIQKWALLEPKEMYQETWDVLRNDKGKVVKWIKTGSQMRKGKYIFTPKLPDKDFLAKNALPKTDTLVFIPYGCAKLRMTVLPVIQNIK